MRTVKILFAIACIAIILFATKADVNHGHGPSTQHDTVQQSH